MTLLREEQKRDPIDVRLHDFDDTSYRVVIDKDARDTLRVRCTIVDSLGRF